MEPTPDELERGRAALRELGVEPLPADVLARLEGRLEGELGRPAPVRRRRRPRLSIAVPGVTAALAAAVVVAVLATNGSGSRPRSERAATLQARVASPLAPKAAAGGAADSSSPGKTFSLKVRVPRLVGHRFGYVRTAARASNLRWALFPNSTCPRVANARVTRQLPRAGAVVPAGTTVRVATCAKAR